MGNVSMNAENNLITSLGVTSGEVYDGHHFYRLVDQVLAKGFRLLNMAHSGPASQTPQNQPVPRHRRRPLPVQGGLFVMHCQCHPHEG